jgi:NADPH:quinone reductase-like Zn-dependent oxidoreductase
MKSIQFSQYGDPSVLHLEDVPTPEPGPGQVLIRVAGTSFNPVDASIRAGYMQSMLPVQLPFVLGVDVAGTVAGVGDGVDGLASGDAVIGFLPMNADGASAEYVLAPAELLAPAPASVPLADAAALPAAALTAWQAVTEHLAVQPGQRVLINGAGGGVGAYAVQFAKQAGATVIAVAGPSSAAIARDAGADEVVDYTAADPGAGEPVDAVFNLVRTEPAALAPLIARIKPGGVFVSATGPGPDDAEPRIRTVAMGVRSEAAQLAEIARQVDAGRVKVLISERRPLAESAAVHADFEAGKLHGKVVVTVAADA